MSSFNRAITLMLLLCCGLHSTAALRCYQGQQNVFTPIQGYPMDCPMMAYSCIKSVDWTMNLASRACQTTNCTVNGMISPYSVCQNATSYPYQTYCCCYGDGCNGATTLNHQLVMAVFALVLVTLVPFAFGDRGSM